ncbi:MAG: 3-hydroxybutyryl-CoA dehydrogenase [Methanomassiliicoccales archaeon]|jgi:3-hydroxybutyryl-CoA dehydrogenase|nr:3-hydroxybutyryl-CoA dehydrogenase [Methanomassiliicoccales archaeon]
MKTVDNVRKIGIVGAGTMGSGIAQVAAQSGYEVILNDISDSFIQNGIAKIQKGLGKAVEKGKMTKEEMANIMSRIRGSVSLEDLANTDVIIEAILEDRAAKKQVFASLDSICKQDAILASNTSSIPITELASATKRPDKVVGMHFFNPAPVMKLVEVIRAVQTSDETKELVKALAVKMGKVPVEVNDFPGFCTNRILVPMINEAAYCLMEGVASAEAIDQVMKLGANHPMGPLELADLIGLDVCLNIMEVLYSEYGDPKYRPCPLLRRLVQAGRLGRKTGWGFHKYE